jgi:hypothetical protein
MEYYHLQFPGVFAGSEPLDKESLPVKQDTVSNRHSDVPMESFSWGGGGGLRQEFFRGGGFNKFN